MFDKSQLQKALVAYKKDFIKKQWPDEKYKWEAVQYFQANWDVNADDFAGMLTRALSKTANLLASANHFPAKMIVGFAGSVPEEVRAMFLSLYDESRDVVERVEEFKQKSGGLLERYGNGAAQHFQDENAIMTYLWLRYPDKYYVYKLGEIRAVAAELKGSYRFKKGAYADNIRNFMAFYDEICDELRRDDELRKLLQSQLTESCYPDPQLRTLTGDVGFYISRYHKKGDVSDEDGWWPKDYTPGFSVEDWLELLADKSIFTAGSMEIMKRLLDYGGKATCKQLAVKYGESANFYNSGSAYLARRIAQKTNCPLMLGRDIVIGGFPCHGAGKADQGGFGHRISRLTRIRHHVSGDRAHDHDPSIPFFLHNGQHSPGRVPDALDVDVDVAVPDLVGGSAKILQRTDSRVIDENIHRSIG